MALSRILSRSPRGEPAVDPASVEVEGSSPRLHAVPAPDPASIPQGEGAVMANVIVFANQKGGVAKTTTSLNLGVAFKEMGFRVAEGPEVEWARYNFDAARIPEDHPARDMWDTIWVNTLIDGERNMLLRTHTTPNQVRVMERTPEPPVRVVVPGKCYRQEATDATHEWMLTQIEGLAVDEGVRMTDLKGVLYGWARKMFGADRKIIFHHSYFPFVEPGVEMAIDCFICRGNGSACHTCHGTGWIEILGAGMVHPEIIENAGYDSAKVTGFAFGLGVERVALLRWGIEDIRNFYANDLRFLSQF
ncbi:MAG: phenylalanine--tRNA ligase subunit alpha [Dehalococcoidia bacterium]|nr:phenylalanine--tRNA ligase subunit alpha [Dehalococcoidia bacterium]